MMAWAWLAWITVSFILFTALFFAARNKQWYTQLNEAWSLRRKGSSIVGEFPIENLHADASQGGSDVDVDRGSINTGFERWKSVVTWLAAGEKESVASTSAV
jgi:hypothetical protein